ncbi:MAG: type II secretion system F family protein [Desulfurococcales archaeon]|nr:type II secretion system F family protein [Desulfurococcales archaeon]
MKNTTGLITELPIGKRIAVSTALAIALILASTQILSPPLLYLVATGAATAPYIIGVIRPLIKRRIITVDIDMLYIFLHMRSVATGKPPISSLFKVISEDPRSYPKYYRIFKRVYLLGKEWGYSFSQAVRLIGEKIENLVLRNIFSRMSGVLAVGEDIESFLDIEYRTLTSEYINMYARTINTARVFMGIYVTMMGSLIFVLVTFMLMAFFFGGNVSIIITSYIGVGVTLVFILILLYILVNKEPFEYHGDPELPRYKLLKIAGIASLMLSLAIAGLLALTREPTFNNIALIMVIVGVILLPIGIIMKRIEGVISNIDEFFPVFIRSFGAHLATIPNMVKALEPLLISQIGKLKKPLLRLYARLSNGVDPQVAWEVFAAESGSELTRRGVKIFIDTVEHGGDIERIGAMISDHHNEMLRLRKQRLQVSKTFESTLYIMHAATIIILVFVTKLMIAFSTILAQLMEESPPGLSEIFPFKALDAPILVNASLILSILLTVLNGMAVTRVSPGHSHSFYYYAAILAIISGVSIAVSSILIDKVLEISLEATPTPINV